jgi:hypothetical protein
MNQQTMLLLDSLKVRFDLTLEPKQTGFPVPTYMEQLFLGERPNYKAVPRQPYYRAAGHWPRKLRIKEIPISTALAESPDIGTLYLANDGALVCRHIDQLLADKKTCHLALPARTDIAIRPSQCQNLETILEHLLNHSERQRFRLAAPSEV